jgi:hypothetical protein
MQLLLLYLLDATRLFVVVVVTKLPVVVIFNVLDVISHKTRGESVDYGDRGD